MSAREAIVILDLGAVIQHQQHLAARDRLVSQSAVYTEDFSGVIMREQSCSTSEAPKAITGMPRTPSYC